MVHQGWTGAEPTAGLVSVWDALAERPPRVPSTAEDHHNSVQV
jgi:hypothetical protein